MGHTGRRRTDEAAGSGSDQGTVADKRALPLRKEPTIAPSSTAVEAPALRTEDLPTVAPRVLARHVVLEALRDGILAERIPAGTRLSEAAIAARMGVSRAPVRGGNSPAGPGGTGRPRTRQTRDVVGLAAREMDVVRRIRALIEANAIAEACSRVTPPDIATLRGLIAQMHAALDQDQIEQVLDLDRQFHEFIVHMSGSSSCPASGGA